MFYNRADASPAVIAEDEATKDTITATYLATYAGEDVDLDTSRVHVPVLTAAGQYDGLMCTSPGTERWANMWIGSSGPLPARHCNGPVGPAS